METHAKILADTRKKTEMATKKTTTKKPAAKKTPAKKPAAAKTTKKPAAKKSAETKASAKKGAAKKAPAKKPADGNVGDAHEKVQLWEGGPYWATTNIGAEKPEDFGYYFWWGDTVGYKPENCKWVATDGSLKGYSFDDKDAVFAIFHKDDGIYCLEQEGWLGNGGVLAPGVHPPIPERAVHRRGHFPRKLLYPSTGRLGCAPWQTQDQGSCRQH